MIALYVHVLPLKKTAVIVHISQLAPGTTLKCWLKTVPRCWDGCFTEPAFTHYSCGQAGAAGRTITPESGNATQLCGLQLDSYPFDTLSVSCRLVVDPSSSLFRFPLKHHIILSLKSVKHCVWRSGMFAQWPTAEIASLMVIRWKCLVISVCFY